MNNDQEEILKRLRELEAENARLKSAAASAEPAKLIVTEGDYKGHPTLTFDGSVRRFTLGLTKLRAIKEALPEIEAFLRRHHKAESENDSDDDGKI